MALESFDKIGSCGILESVGNGPPRVTARTG